MYIPSHYKNENISEVKDFIKEHSFAILVTQVDGKPWATHTPLELEVNDKGEAVLIGHIARANPQWKYFDPAEEVLCIFNGPHSYVSSSWYKEEEVPTWNYIAVHVYGKLSVMTEQEVLTWLHALVDKYEKGVKHPISLSNMSPATLRQVKGVVGFRIAVSSIQAAYKLSQGREKDHAQIIKELSSNKDAGSREISKRMQQA
ncbi:MAG: FMN-binding negative transcriptional regulator, partial [Eudoraea sp.]|nr:FMN-binding negative transcriptional regulator [Eudoraea sp.]